MRGVRGLARLLQTALASAEATVGTVDDVKPKRFDYEQELKDAKVGRVDETLFVEASWFLLASSRC